MIDLGIVQVHGARVELQASKPMAVHLQEALADLVGERSSPPTHHIVVRRRFGRTWTVDASWGNRYRGGEMHLALYDTLTALNELAAHQAARAGDVVLHGGAIAADGRGVAFVGHSGAGKSTLTAAMSMAGYPYLADEVVAVDEALQIRPFHRPIGLRASGAAVLGHHIPAGPFETSFPFAVGRSATLSGPVPLGLVLLLGREEGIEPGIRQLRPALALFTLANETLGAAGFEPEMFGRLERLVRAVPVGRLEYSSVEDVGVLMSSALDVAASWSL